MCKFLFPKRAVVMVVVFLTVGLQAPRLSAQLLERYSLNGTFADDLGGPALVPSTANGSTGTLGASSYSFGANQGLTVSNALPDTGNYSIVIDFSFTDLGGYRKIIDFAALNSDAGLYDLNTNLNFYPVTTSSTPNFDVNVYVRLVLTRDGATGVVNGYINGTQQISLLDSNGSAVFSGANGIINFFNDDNATGQREASGGTVDQIGIYASALSATQVAALGGPGGTLVPEPGTWGWVAGLGAAGLLWSRRDRGVKNLF